jgi:zinc D-Ala-D-Ala carboxypeptidase
MKPPQIKRPRISRQTIRLIFITVCSAIVVIVMGLSGSRSNNTALAPEPAFQQASLASPQTPNQIPSQTKSASTALTFDKMPVTTSPTIPAQPLPIVPAKLTSAPQEKLAANAVQVQTKYGHFPYAENEPDRLVDAGRFVRGTYERSERLDLEAEQAFREMTIAAKTQGIFLMPISGFRNIDDQSELFRKQIARRGSETEAARASAPPGHSEHHTGYAIDIGDQQSDTDLKLSFQDTAAYQWLLANAANYGFEQSFPLNNKQGVNFEPWHWRYFGTPRAAQVFAAARRS